MRAPAPTNAEAVATVLVLAPTADIGGTSSKRWDLGGRGGRASGLLKIVVSFDPGVPNRRPTCGQGTGNAPLWTKSLTSECVVLRDGVATAGDGGGRTGYGRVVPKKRSARQRKAAAEAARRERRRRLEESFNEEHARLVVERHGDPRFVQRVRTQDGADIRWDPETQTGRELNELMIRQRAMFRDRFGRDPGPADPLFFDPETDQPRPLTDGQWETDLDKLAATAAEAGLKDASSRSEL